MIRRLAGVAIIVALVIVWCLRPDPPSPVPAPTAPSAPAPSTPQSTARGAVFGRAVWRGVRPPQQTIGMTGGGCDSANERPVPWPRFAVAADGGLPHVFLWAHHGPHLTEATPPDEEPVVVEFRGCMLHPYLIGTSVGRPVRFINRDSFCGALKIGSKLNAHEEVPKLGVDAFVDIVFRHKEMPLHVGCPVHSWCTAVVFVVDHAHFATTAADGKFEIAGLPPGEYEFRAWREGFSADRLEIAASFRANVEPGGQTDIGEVVLK